MKLFGRKRQVIDSTINQLNKRPKDELLKIQDAMETELAKLPKKKRMKAEKLLKMYEKGQYLRPNKDVDNKKIISENK